MPLPFSWQCGAWDTSWQLPAWRPRALTVRSHKYRHQVGTPAWRGHCAVSAKISQATIHLSKDVLRSDTCLTTLSCQPPPTLQLCRYDLCNGLRLEDKLPEASWASHLSQGRAFVWAPQRSAHYTIFCLPLEGYPSAPGCRRQTRPWPCFFTHGSSHKHDCRKLLKIPQRSSP